MTSSEFSEQDLDRLLQAYLDEQLSETDAAKVEALLNDDATARERMVEILGVRGLIAVGGGALRDGPGCRVAIREMPDYRSGTLAPGPTGRFCRHLETCLRCQQVWRAFERDEIDLRGLVGSPVRPILVVVAVVVAMALALVLGLWIAGS